MSTPSVTPSPFVPSRFLKRQLYVIAVGVTAIVAAVIVWPRLSAWLLATDFLPHAYCYLGKPGVVWTNVVADSLVAFAYLTISVTLG
jgi:hypothetical protein